MLAATGAHLHDRTHASALARTGIPNEGLTTKEQPFPMATTQETTLPDGSREP